MSRFGELTPSDKYFGEWQGYRKMRARHYKLMGFSFLAAIPFIFTLVKYAASPGGGGPWDYFVFGIFTFLVWIFLGVLFSPESSWPCPRCNKEFLGGAGNNALFDPSFSCVYCGLPKYAPDDSAGQGRSSKRHGVSLQENISK